jgi:hypothetical protein
LNLADEARKIADQQCSTAKTEGLQNQRKDAAEGSSRADSGSSETKASAPQQTPGLASTPDFVH